jgi:5-methylthioadenosine/S-adenosylhomocysteine deaminase
MILLKDISCLLLDAHRLKQNQDLLIDGNRIKKIGRVDPEEIEKNTIILNCRHKVIIPGLVNAHTHLWQSLIKGRRDDLSLVPWCREVLFPLIRSMKKRENGDGMEDLSYLWSMLGAIEMVRAGITSFIDMDTGYSPEQIPQAWLDIGIRGTLALELADQWLPDNVAADMGKEKEEILKLIENWHNVPAEGPLIQVAMGPSAPFTCSEKLLSWTHDQADKYNLGLQIHVSETSWEVEESLRNTGKTPLAYLDSLGFLSRPIMAVHCVHLTDKEIELAKEHSVIPVYNPKSNMKLGSGIAPVVKMLKSGLQVALATDGPASNDLMDMFEEMRTGAMLQRVAHEDAAILGAGEMFRMATEVGAKCCRSGAGVIDETRPADLVIIDPSAAHSFRLGDKIIPWLVYCVKSCDVESVIINGRLVMQDRKLTGIDEQALLKEIRRVAKRLQN